MNHHDEALKHFEEVISLEKKVKTELWTIPFSTCQIGEIYLERKDIAQATKYFNKSLSFTKYDFENWIHARIKRGNEKIEKLKSES